METLKHISFKFRYYLLFLICIFSGLLNVYPGWKTNVEKPYIKLFFLLFLLLALCFFFFMFRKTAPTTRELVFVIFAIGFFLRLVYTLYTGCMTRQHDVHTFGGENGHAAYIEYFYNGNTLPDFDVRTVWQFYHPPLHHAICAIWLKIQTLAGISYQAALENLQQLTLFYSSAVMLLSYKLFSLFSLKGKAMVTACALVAFHPTFILLSGSINNDMLCIMLTLLSAVVAIKWYREPTLKNILLLALSIGFAMMAKLSGGLIAVAVAMLFFVKLCDRQYPIKKLFVQYASFGVLCVPLALWWEIRNLLAFGVPLTYVPGLAEKVTKYGQYVGFRSVWERLFDISSMWEAGIYPARATEYLIGKYGFEYFEYNIPAAALKSSVFGEYYIGADSPLFSAVAAVLFWSAAALATLSAVAAVRFLIKLVKSRKDTQGFAKENGFSVVEGAFTLVFYVTMIFSYVNFCFGYPHYCTMDFRYIALTVVLGALYIGFMLRDAEKKHKMSGKVFVWATVAATIVFAAASTILYVFTG